jgi:hypothetical protein|eukprot:COSAG02_NODE_411_length_22864_cov_6.757523_10_plen_153_part_00
MTTEDVTLQATDLYPAPKADTKLAVREHYTHGKQSDGCEDGKPALHCVEMLAAGQMPSLPPAGGNISDFVYISVYEPASNGAYFLGELDKFVHVSPQRFDSVLVKGSGPCGLTVSVKGTSGDSIDLPCIDAKGIVHVKSASISAAGSVDVAI